MAGSNAAKSMLGELAKRVPNNQKKQFRKFLELNKEYRKRLSKYPEKLPKIDWEYYRTNVRIKAIKMVDEFEKKYEELNKVFDDRVKLDTKKYYDELEKQRVEVQAQVKQYIAESNERVKAYEAEIERLCTMKPYSSMTMEEFINLRPECSNYIPHQRKPLFWPHDPEEQIPGSVELMTPGRSSGGGGDDAGGGGGGGDAGGRGGKHPVKPGDIQGDTVSFEFKEVEVKPTKQEATIRAAAPEELPQEETKQEVPSKSVEEPKYYMDKPASKEEKQKLDPCGLIEKEKRKPEIVKTPTESGKKSHPCDLVKGTREPTAKEDFTCETPTKGPHKDANETCVFLDPCNMGFGKQVTAKVEPADRLTAEQKQQPLEAEKAHPCEMVKKQPKSDNDPCKKEQSKPVEPKKIQPCEMVKKQPDPEKDPCRKVQSKPVDTKKTQPSEVVKKQHDPEKDPCKKEQSKPVEPKKTQPCEMVKKQPDPDKDPCKKKQSKPVEPKKTQPCEMVKKQPDPEKGPCKKEQSKPVEPKKIQPCEMVMKKTGTNEEACRSASTKDQYKDAKGACVFLDPCNVGFGASVPAKVEPAVIKSIPKAQPTEAKKPQHLEPIKKKPDPDNCPCKSVAKKQQPQPIEPKKTQPCETIKNKTERNKEVCKGHSKDEKGASVFLDPCNVGFGKLAVEKNSAPMPEPKPQPKESKKTQPSEVVKKKSDPDKDSCKSATKKEQPQPVEPKKTQPCESIKKKSEPDKDPCKSAAKKGQSKGVDPCSVGSVAAKSPKSKAADSKVKRSNTLHDPCNWQPVRPKKLQPRDDMIKDNDSCTMVFADSKNAKSDSSKDDKKKHSKSCGALPYYNPFRSEQENRRNEEKMCEENEKDDPCARDEIKEDYYNPCKDDKDDKDEEC